MTSYKKYLPLAGLGVGLVVLLALAVGFNTTAPALYSGYSGSQCNVAVASIEGVLSTSPDPGYLDSLTVSSGIRDLAGEGGHAALVVLLNSEGGSATAAQEISDALDEVALPTVAFVRSAALSGGYWIALHTQHIVASPTAAVGSIGVTSSYLDETKLNAIKGYTYQPIVAGEYKDAGNVNKPLTQKDREFLQDLTNKMYKLFVDEVVGMREMPPEQVQKLADGRYYLAAEAKALGLIDEVGSLEDVQAYLATTLETAPEDIVLCPPVRFYPQALPEEAPYDQEIE